MEKLPLSSQTAEEKGREKTVVRGVLLLTLSSIIVKFCGLIFKIPMNHLVGDTVMGYYNSAYSVFSFFYMLSTSGLPVGVSVMIAEQRSRGQLKSARLTYRVAMALFCLIGLAGSAVMLILSTPAAELIKSEKSALSIVTVAPALFFICISATVSGYFRGAGNMLPTAVSQLIEAVLKVAGGLGGAVYALRMGYSAEVVSAYSVFGLTVGSAFGAVYLLIVKKLRGDGDLCSCACPEDVPQKMDILRRLWRIAWPVTLSASVMSLTSLIDTATIQRALRLSGMSEEMAATLYGNYTSLAVPMFNLPPTLVYPVAYSLVPLVTGALASCRAERASHHVNRALRYALIVGLPCALGMSVLAHPILSLIYTDLSADMAAPLLSVLAPSGLFLCVLAVTNSTLQASGQERMTVVSMAVGAAVKLLSGALLLRRYGIMGAPVSTFLCYFTVTLANLYFIRKRAKLELKLAKLCIKPLLSAVLCAFSAALTYRITAARIGSDAATLISIVTSAVVYGGALLLTGEVTADEIADLIPTTIKKRKDKNEHRTEEKTAHRRAAHI